MWSTLLWISVNEKLAHSIIWLLCKLDEFTKQAVTLFDWWHITHLRFCGTWQEWPWRAWVEQKRLVIGDRSVVRCFSPVKYPASRCCYAPDRDACQCPCLRLHLDRHFVHRVHCGDRKHRPHRCPPPRAQTSSPCPRAVTLGFVLSFFCE